MANPFTSLYFFKIRVAIFALPSNPSYRRLSNPKKFSILEILGEAIQYLSIHLSFAEELLKIGSGPTLGMNFETITSNDSVNMDKLYRADYEELTEHEEDGDEGSFQGLSSSRRKLLQRIDAFLDEVRPVPNYIRSATSFLHFPHFNRF